MIYFGVSASYMTLYDLSIRALNANNKILYFSRVSLYIIANCGIVDARFKLFLILLIRARKCCKFVFNLEVQFILLSIQTLFLISIGMSYVISVMSYVIIFILDQTSI